MIHQLALGKYFTRPAFIPRQKGSIANTDKRGGLENLSFISVSPH